LNRRQTQAKKRNSFYIFVLCIKLQSNKRKENEEKQKQNEIRKICLFKDSLFFFLCFLFYFIIKKIFFLRKKKEEWINEKWWRMRKEGKTSWGTLQVHPQVGIDKLPSRFPWVCKETKLFGCFFQIRIEFDFIKMQWEQVKQSLKYQFNARSL
jgi:hypothetical protein